MPANSAYLTKSNWQRFAKITAGILGGYLVSTSLHLALAFWFNKINVIVTFSFTGFILWSILLIFAFLAKNGWKIWAIYLLLTLIFAGFIYVGNYYSITQ